MHSPIQFFEVPNSFSPDPLSRFISSFTFIPKGFGHQSHNPSAVCGDRIIGDFELIYVLGGKSFITINQKEYTCGAGDIVIIPPFVKHRIQTPAEDPHDNYWLHFELFPLHLQEQFINAMILPSDNRLHVGIQEELTSLYERLEKEMNAQKPGSMAIFHAVLVEILTVVLRLSKAAFTDWDEKKTRYPSEVSLVNKCIDFILKNTYSPIGIDTLCKQMNVSEPYLFKAFRHVLNMPPNHFIQLSKIKKAEQLIKSTELSFKEIAETLGFKSQYYFSNVFKKYYKVSPKMYKKVFMEC